MYLKTNSVINYEIFGAFYSSIKAWDIQFNNKYSNTNINIFQMKAIKQYRIKLILTEPIGTNYCKTLTSDYKRYSTINEVNKAIDSGLYLFKDYIKEEDYLVESYDWDKCEFVPIGFGKIKNTFKDKNV